MITKVYAMCSGSSRWNRFGQTMMSFPWVWWYIEPLLDKMSVVLVEVWRVSAYTGIWPEEKSGWRRPLQQCWLPPSSGYSATRATVRTEMVQKWGELSWDFNIGQWNTAVGQETSWVARPDGGLQVRGHQADGGLRVRGHQARRQDR